MVGLAVFAASAFGAGPFAEDAARAYVLQKPDGAYAPLALKLLVELDARRRLASDGTERRRLLEDLVFRPRDRARVQKVYGESSSPGRSSEGRELRAPLRGSPKSTVREARSALEYLQIRLKRLERDTTRCDRIRRREPYLGCIADVMDQFATEIERMPKTPESVAPVAVPALREAAMKVRTAETIPAARAAVAEAVTEVRKSIDLVQAGGDDQLRRLELGQRSIVLNALATVDTSLVQAVGI
jgi:hypothetical protein